MLWQEFSPLTRETKIEPEKALQFGFGVAAAPMWAAYMAVAGAGVSYWMMTSWTRRVGLSVEPRSFAPAFEPVAAALEAVVAVEAVAAESLTFEAPAVVEPATPEVAPEVVAAIAPIETAPLETAPAIDLASVTDETPVVEASVVEPVVLAAAEGASAPVAKTARRKPAPKQDA
jgi:hypothetical protein